jgi:hypothetical protein
VNNSREKIDPKGYGFWRIVAGYGVGPLLFAWDFILAAILGTLGTWLYVSNVREAAKHQQLVADVLQVASSLFGVILAGFAIVAAFFGQRYAQLVKQAGTSPLNMLRHFLFVGVLTIITVSVAIAFRAFGESLSKKWSTGEHILLGLTLLLFFWSLFATVELTKLILAVAHTSAEAASREPQQDQT